jgi:hypothetical protein
MEVLTYNPFLPEVREDPYPTYHALREAEPVQRSPFMELWILTRYEDGAANRDPARWPAGSRTSGSTGSPSAARRSRCLACAGCPSSLSHLQ